MQAGGAGGGAAGAVARPEQAEARRRGRAQGGTGCEPHVPPGRILCDNRWAPGGNLL